MMERKGNVLLALPVSTREMIALDEQQDWNCLFICSCINSDYSVECLNESGQWKKWMEEVVAN
jgi:hypothetical protein